MWPPFLQCIFLLAVSPCLTKVFGLVSDGIAADIVAAAVVVILGGRPAVRS